MIEQPEVTGREVEYGSDSDGFGGSPGVERGGYLGSISVGLVVGDHGGGGARGSAGRDGGNRMGDGTGRGGVGFSKGGLGIVIIGDCGPG